jgi:hypothetical protein
MDRGVHMGDLARWQLREQRQPSGGRTRSTTRRLRPSMQLPRALRKVCARRV